MRAPRQPQETMLIGVDVGGTKTAIGAVAAADCALLEKHVVATPPLSASGGKFVEQLCTEARTLRDKAMALGWSCGGIGISLCELVDRAGQPASGYRVDWRGSHAQALFAALAPCVIEADVRAAALAEARLGAGRGFGSFAYINLGTGISSSLVHDGVPYAGARGNALVLGIGPALNVLPDGASSTYVPEEIAGGAGIVARYNALGHQAVSALDILAAADAGDADAVGVAALAGRVAGAAIGFLVNVTDPEAVVVGGGLATGGGIHWDHMMAQLRATIWSESTRDLPVLPAGLKADSALIGAALAARPVNLHNFAQRENRAG